MSNYIKTTSSFIQRNVRYSDISIGFGLNPFTEDVTRVTEVDAVKRSIRSLVLTDKYERLLDPDIGGNVRALLFEPMNGITSGILQDYIQETITNYEPIAILEQVFVQPDYDRNSYEVTIRFTINSTEETQEFAFFLERVR